MRACNQVNDLSVNFTVQYAVESSHETSQTRQMIVTRTNTQIPGLTPYTDYSIKVAVVTQRSDVRLYSYRTTVQTLEDGKH